MAIVETYKNIAGLAKIEKSFSGSLKKTELKIDDLTSGNPKWFKEVLDHLVKAGGKRVRPLLSFLSHSLISEEVSSDSLITVAALSEIIHSATLFHDDVIDEGQERRGKPTANKVYGNHTAILSGDFLLGKVFEEVIDLKNFDLLKSTSNTVNRLIEGEVFQLDLKKRSSVTLVDYEKLIYLKTASLFEWCSSAPGYLLNVDDSIQLNLKKMGFHIGRIFQIVDDVLDYVGNKVIGKKNLQDFYQGKITLPLFFVFKDDNQYFSHWKQALSSNNYDELDKLSKLFTKRIKQPDIQNDLKSYLNKEVNDIKEVINDLPFGKKQSNIYDLLDFLVNRVI